MLAFLRKLWVFVQPYRLRLFLGLLCGMLYSLASGALVMAIGPIGDLVSGSVQAQILLTKAPAFLRPIVNRLTTWFPAINAPSSQLGWVLLVSIIPAIVFIRVALNYASIYLVNWSAARAIADIRTKLFEHLQNLSLGFLSRASTGDLISRITNDTQVLYGIIGTSLASIVKDPITIVVLLGWQLAKWPQLTVISILVLPLGLIPIIIYGRKVRKAAAASQGHIANLTRLMHESFTGNRIVKAYHLEDAMVAQFRSTTSKYVGQAMRVIRANELPSQFTELFGAIGIALVALYLKSAGQKLSTGGLLGFAGTIALIYPPIKALTRLHNQLNQAQSASRRVFELLDTPNTVVDPPIPIAIEADHADIHFEGIDFDYGEKPVLRGIELTVRSGQFVGVAGSSGSGKTTLVNLLPRFYDPQRGAVRIGGTDIRQATIKDLRGQIALVTQETILFDDTFRRNIAVGRPGASDAEIENAARRAKAHEFIMEKPQGYETVVGEKGVLLSGGQKQRIAIARAILRDAPVLILDEATSALDTESERAVQAELEVLMRGRTTLCIAHRLSTIQKADVIVVLDGGRIVEQGTHAELMRRQGVYWKLYVMQFESAKAELAPPLAAPGAGDGAVQARETGKDARLSGG